MADQHESERQHPRRAAIGRDQFDAEESRGFINRPSGLPTRTPTCPSPNAPVLFGRDTIRDEIIARLRHDEGTLAINAVRGLPGIGKTDLLRAIGGDLQITAHFAGGVLYAELGPTPDRSQIMRRWITEMGMEPPLPVKR